MLLSMAIATYIAVDRIKYYSEWNRSTVDHLDTVLRLSSQINNYSENIAELLLLGKTQLDDVYTTRSRLEELIARLRSLTEQEVSFVRTAEEQAAATKELDRVRTMQELLNDIDLIVQRLLFLHEEGREGEAVQLFQDHIELRLDAELGEHISAAIAGEDEKLRFFAQQTTQLQQRLTLLVGGVTLTALVISAIAGFSLTRSLTRPIRDLIAGTRAIGDGNLSYRIAYNRDDEFQDLARQFNSTAACLETQHAQILKVQAGLESEVARRTNQLEEVNARLQRLDHMRMLFLADIGHELRTPLTILRGEAEVALRASPTTAADLRETLRNVVQLSQQMGRLVEDLLFLARAEVGAIRFEMQKLVLQDLLDIALREVRVLAERTGHRLDTTIPAEPCNIDGDAERLMQALLIVLDNALKHSAPGGLIELTLDRIGADVHLAVRNTGLDIDANDLPFVFNRFYRGRRNGNDATTGCGLGLPIAKWIVDTHGGRIAISSGSGKTELTIQLPLAA